MTRKMPTLKVLIIIYCVFGAAAAVAPLPTAELVDGARLAAAQAAATEPPSDGQRAATGKLNQFKGFYTPRPLPSNAQLVYSSVWAGWSAWSFCANHEQIRVRACNTVRGFNCLGPNRESKPCGFDSDVPLTPPTPSGGADETARDYDAVDPWAEDRQEALRQMHAEPIGPDVPLGVKPASVSKTVGDDFARQRSAGRTFQSRRNSYGGGESLQTSLANAPAAGIDQEPAEALNLTLLFDTQTESAGTSFVPTGSVALPADTLSTISAPAVPTPPHKGDGKHTYDQRTATDSQLLISADTVLMVGDDAASRQFFSNQTAENKGAVKEQLTPIGTPTGLQTADDDSRTTMAEPPQPLPLASVALADGAVEKNMLHSAEIVFPKDERISLETAKAFEWMLASMSKAADAELLIDAKQKKKQKSNRHRNAQHSGEPILPQRQPASLNSSEFNLQSTAVQLAAISGARNKKPARALASRQWAPPANKIDAIAAGDAKQSPDERKVSSAIPQSGGIYIRPSVGDALSDASAEKLERDLVKIQSVMRQIEGELEALKRAEGALDGSATAQQQKQQHILTRQQQQKHQQSRRTGAIHARVRSLTEQPPLGIDLVPTADPTPVLSPGVTATAPQQEVFSVAAGFGDLASAEWSDWRPWAQCFCGRQVRTRVCKYDPVTSSKGCAGRSYESRHCASLLDKCPTARVVSASPPSPLAEKHDTMTSKVYTLAPPRADRPPAGAMFRPRPLALAAPTVVNRR